MYEAPTSDTDPTIDTGMTSSASASLRRRWSGRVIGGRYRLIAPLSAGAMGALFVAEQIGLGRQVAVKLLHPAMCTPEVSARFEREARVASAIDHPNVVEVYDFVRVDDEEAAIVMEYVRGRSLADVIRNDNVIEPARAVRLALPLLSALARAHELGIVHRDIKPSNVMITRVPGLGEVPKLIDFGIAKAAADVPLTSAGLVLGTPLFMAPEQAAGRVVDGRADVYAVAAVLYRMLAGTGAVHGDTLPAMLDAVLHEVPVPVRTHNPCVPEELEAVVMRGLAKRPEDRWSSAIEMAHALENALGRAEARASEVTVVHELAPEPYAEVVLPAVPAGAAALRPVSGLALAAAGRSAWTPGFTQLVAAKLAVLGVAAMIALGVLGAWVAHSIAQESLVTQASPARFTSPGFAQSMP